MTTLDDLFEEEVDESTYRYVLSVMGPSCDRGELVAGLARLMARNKSDPKVTQDLLLAVGWTNAVAALQKGRVSVRRGDFGEVLAAEAAEAFDDLAVPVRKLRYQIDPNQTLPGSDVVAMELGFDSIEALEFIESKYRTNPAAGIAVDAHEQLATDRLDGYATTVGFLANRLNEIDPDLYDWFLTYLSSRGADESRSTVVLTYDESNWSDAIAEDLEDLEEHLPDLMLRLFPLNDAAGLIDETYDLLKWEVLDDE